MNNNFIPSKLYYQILKNIPIACVDIIINFNGKILLVKRLDPPALGEWWIPGGRVLKGEMLRDTAKRKALEEVGIECNVGPIIYTDETIFSDGPKGIPVHSINTCFYLHPINKNFKCNLDKHHSNYIWINKIPEDINIYVKNCLMTAGLK